MIHVEIFSLHAAVAGGRATTWTGWIAERDLSGPEGLSTDEHLHTALFRFFNVVDENDVLRLKGYRYTLPSLSVGDIITFGDESFVVSGTGFDKISQTTLGRDMLFSATFE